MLLFIGIFVLNVLPQENAWMLESKEGIQKNTPANEIKVNSIKQIEKWAQSEWENHSPILIDGNVNFLAHAALEIWDGDGSDTDPYVITGLNITNQTSVNLIEIKNTDVYFNITNNLLVGGANGINLENVTNGFITNNFILNTTINGIFLKESIGNTINNNLVNLSIYSGILLSDSPECTLLNNTVLNTASAYGAPQGGIKLQNSPNCFLSINLVQKSADNGIIVDKSPHCLLLSNNISSSESTISAGLAISDSRFINLTRNILENSGIGLYSCNDSMVYSNIIRNGDLYSYNSSHSQFNGNALNDWAGMVIKRAEFCNISNNILYRTRDNEIDIAYSNIHWNDFITYMGGYWGHLRHWDNDNNLSHNFYDDWTVPDDDNDGIVDIPYRTEGVDDEYPLTHPHNPSPIHYITKPKILFPTGDETLNETITIRWTTAFDSFDHQLSYSVYYVSNPDFSVDMSWIELATDLRTTSYEWDTSSIEVSSMTLIRVVANCSEGMSAMDENSNTFRIDNQHIQKDGVPGFTIPSFLLVMIITVFMLKIKKNFKS